MQQILSRLCMSECTELRIIRCLLLVFRIILQSVQIYLLAMAISSVLNTAVQQVNFG